MNYDKKYLKYKTKYFKLVEELEGGGNKEGKGVPCIFNGKHDNCFNKINKPTNNNPKYLQWKKDCISNEKKCIKDTTNDLICSDIGGKFKQGDDGSCECTTILKKEEEFSFNSPCYNTYEKACNKDTNTCLAKGSSNNMYCRNIKDGEKKGTGGMCETKFLKFYNFLSSKKGGGSEEKYLKYKTKYYELKEMIGGRHRLFGPPMFGHPIIGPPLYGPILPLPLYSNLVVPFVPKPCVRRYITNNFTNKSLLFTNKKQNIVNTCKGTGLCPVNVNNNSPKIFYIYDQNGDNIYSNDKTITYPLSENEKINWNSINNQFKLLFLQSKINENIPNDSDKITTIYLYLY
jgi:hypothetical protein